MLQAFITGSCFPFLPTLPSKPYKFNFSELPVMYWIKCAAPYSKPLNILFPLSFSLTYLVNSCSFSRPSANTISYIMLFPPQRFKRDFFVIPQHLLYISINIPDSNSLIKCLISSLNYEFLKGKDHLCIIFISLVPRVGPMTVEMFSAWKMNEKTCSRAT